MTWICICCSGDVEKNNNGGLLPNGIVLCEPCHGKWQPRGRK